MEICQIHSETAFYHPVREANGLHCQSSQKSQTTAPHPSPSAFYKLTSLLIQFLIAASLGRFHNRPSSAASALGGDTRPTTAPQSLLGALSAPATTNPPCTLPPPVPTPNMTSSSARTALRNIGLPPEPAPSTRLVSTLRGWLRSNNNDSIGLEKPAALDHAFLGTRASTMKNCLNTDLKMTMKDFISPPPPLLPRDSCAARTA